MISRRLNSDAGVRMVCNLVAGNVPIRDEGVVCVCERGKVGHLGAAAVWVSSLSEELVNRVNGIGLNGVVRRKDDELWHFFLQYRSATLSDRNCRECGGICAYRLQATRRGGACTVAGRQLALLRVA